jgi:hypothetical protein
MMKLLKVRGSLNGSILKWTGQSDFHQSTIINHQSLSGFAGLGV